MTSPSRIPFSVNDLLSHKLLIVSGKGGVGKTTLALSLALLAAEKGKSVIVAEINSEEQVSHILERSPIGYEETELIPGLWGINITPKQAFEEYVLLQIRFKTLYRAIFENKLVRHFIDATPGLADLMMIGKIYSLTNKYDLVVVDAPATGHGLALLEIPSIVSDAVRIGPLRSESEKIDLLLNDPKKTQILLATLPEEMPATEVSEMRDYLISKTKLPMGPLFLNQFQQGGNFQLTQKEMIEFRSFCQNHNPPSEWMRVWDKVEIQSSREERSASYLSQLSKTFSEGVSPQAVVPIPFIYSSKSYHFGLSEIQRIASAIEATDCDT